MSVVVQAGPRRLGAGFHPLSMYQLLQQKLIYDWDTLVSTTEGDSEDLQFP
jgi:hypothetical protein